MPPKGSTKAAPAPSTPDPTAGPSSSALAVPDTPSMAQQRLHTAGLADFELPKTTLTKLAKGSVSARFPDLRKDLSVLPGCSAELGIEEVPGNSRWGRQGTLGDLHGARMTSKEWAELGRQR